MNLDFSEEQQMLRDTVRRLCEEHAPIEVVRQFEDDSIGYPAAMWNQMGELGLLGLTVPEPYGGSGMAALEGAIVYEELGRALAPTPHFVSCVLGAGAILTAGSEEQKKKWLPRICSGEAIVTPAWLEPGNGFGPRGVQLRAVKDGAEFVLSGTKLHAHFASSAAALLVLARTGDAETDVDIFIVDPASPGVTLTQQVSLASDTQYKVELADVRVSADDRVGAAGGGWNAWHDTMLDGAILSAAQATGGAQRAMEITVEYAKVREQFGKPLGAFQALAHYLADGQTTVDGGATLVYEAAWARSMGRPVDRLAPMAKLFCCQTYRDVTAMCVQVHGGMGFTVEYDIQLFFRRAKQLQLTWWDTRYLEELVAASVLDREAS